MTTYILKRLFLTIPVMLGVSMLIFAMVRLIPGNIVDLLIGPEVYVGPEYRAELMTKFGLDQPLYVQYWRWLSQVLQGNLGDSLRTQQPIMQTILQKLPLTIELALLSMICSAVVAIPLGVISAVNRNSIIDFVVRLVAMIGLSLPNFWLASMLLLVTSVVFKWSPKLGNVGFFSDPINNLSQLAMPIFALSLTLMAIVMRMTRSSMLEVLRQDYMQTARAKGLMPRVIMVRHALKNALIPVITVMGVQLGGLLGGVVVIEQIFGLPGIGWLLLQGIYQRDYPMIQGTVLLIAVIFVMVNLLVDLLYAALDPRIRFG